MRSWRAGSAFVGAADDLTATPQASMARTAAAIPRPVSDRADAGTPKPRSLADRPVISQLVARRTSMPVTIPMVVM